jgi:hypothetical protein
MRAGGTRKGTQIAFRTKNAFSGAVVPRAVKWSCMGLGSALLQSLLEPRHRVVDERTQLQRKHSRTRIDKA